MLGVFKMRKFYLLLGFLFVCLFGAQIVYAEDSVSNATTRYMSIVIDNSMSMDGLPLDYEKQATKSMLNDLKQSKDNNYVSLIAMHGSASEISDFTNDIDSVIGKVDSINPEWSTNYSEALSTVSKQFANINLNQNVEKVLFLCSDGIPVTGAESNEGLFSYKDSSSYYKYANAALNMANGLKDDNISIYTLGFFHSLTNDEKLFGEKLLTNIASNKNQFYSVTDSAKLIFEFGKVSDDVLSDEDIHSKFNYARVDKEEDSFSDFVYKDSYFDKSSYVYNSQLSKMSLSLAMSAFGSLKSDYDDYKKYPYKYKSVNLEDLLEKMHFENIDMMDTYYVRPTTDSIAAGVANKKIKANGEAVTLIALAVRGAGYESEWTSNLTVGDKNNHNGFEKAKNDVREFLVNYIKENQISGKVKFWITGFSRAAATSNLLAASIIDNHIADLNYSSEDVYGYTFETPAGTIDKNHSNDCYSGIFNIVNRNDVVPRVAPRQWGFYRYGQDLYLPTRTSTSSKIYDAYEKQMLGVYGALNEGSLSYLIDDFRFQGDRLKKTDMVAFMNDFISLLSKKVISSRDVYYQNFEQDIRYVASTYYSLSDKDKNIFVDALLKKLNDYTSHNKLRILHLKQNYDDIINIFIDVYQKHIDSKFSKSQLERLFKKTVYILGSISFRRLDDMLTLLTNFKVIGSAHYPELCYAWMSVMPDYDEKVFFNNGGYRFIHINCPVDVNVYDANHTLVASIENEQPKEISSLVAGVDADGQKYVILPNTDDYTIEIKARKDTKVNYGVDEYSALAGEYTRFVNYFDVDMKKDEVIIASVPKQSQEELDNSIPEGSNQVYSLSQNGSNLQATSDLKGNAAKSAYYDVEVISEDENKGMTSGNVFKAYGQFAEIQAEAKDGYQFIGWFVDNQKVSDQNIYRIRVEKPLKYVAKFEKKKDSTTSSSNQSSKTTGSTNDTTQSSTLVEKQANQVYKKKNSAFMNAGMRFIPYVAIGLGLIIVSVFLIHINRKRK